MKHLCPLYNGQNLNFTGNQNPYGLIQNGGKRQSRCLKRSNCRGRSFTRCRLKYGCKHTKTGKRKSYCRSRKNRSA